MKKQNAIRGVRHAVESDNVIITKVVDGIGQVRVDAKTRWLVPDKNNTLSRWVSKEYLNRLTKERYGKNFRDAFYNILY